MDVILGAHDYLQMILWNELNSCNCHQIPLKIVYIFSFVGQSKVKRLSIQIFCHFSFQEHFYFQFTFNNLLIISFTLILFFQIFVLFFQWNNNSYLLDFVKSSRVGRSTRKIFLFRTRNSDYLHETRTKFDQVDTPNTGLVERDFRRTNVAKPIEKTRK